MMTLTSPLVLKEIRRDVRKLAALLQQPIDLSDPETKQILPAINVDHASHVQKDLQPTPYHFIKMNRSKRQHSSNGFPALQKSNGSVNILGHKRAAQHLETPGDKLPIIRKQPTLPHHRNTPVPDFVSERRRKKRSDLHASYTGFLHPNDIDNYNYEKIPKHSKVIMTQSLDLPRQKPLPVIQTHHNKGQVQKEGYSLKMTSFDHKITSNKTRKAKVKPKRKKHEAVENITLDYNESIFDQNESIIVNENESIDLTQRCSSEMPTPGNKEYNIDHVDSESESDSDNDMQEDHGKALEYHLKYKHGVIPRIKRRVQPPPRDIAQADLESQIQVYDFMKSERGAENFFSFMEEAFGEDTAQNGWAPEVCKQCNKAGDHHEQWCSEYSSNDDATGKTDDEVFPEEIVNILDNPKEEAEVFDRMARLQQRHAMLAEKAAAMENEQKNKVIAFTRPGANDLLNISYDNPLIFPSGTKEAYMKALRVAQMGRFPPEPWMMSGRISRAFVFSYQENVPQATPSSVDVSRTKLPKLKIKNEMIHIFGKENVNDYYPGGPKNPLDPIKYRHFLQLVNSKPDVTKIKRSKTEKNMKGKSDTKMSLKLEHSHTQLDIQDKLQMSNSKRQP